MIKLSLYASPAVMMCACAHMKYTVVYVFNKYQLRCQYFNSKHLAILIALNLLKKNNSRDCRHIYIYVIVTVILG